MIRLNVNGFAREVDASPDTPLLWVLREHLNLTGTKYGCGVAACGACTVHLGKGANAAATRSCVLPVSAVQGMEVTTVEGLSPDGTHALQQAWEELDVPHCGYCQAGQIMSAVSLLKSNPNPSDADIDAAMTNICRCGTYPRMRAAIKRAAKALREGRA